MANTKKRLDTISQIAKIFCEAVQHVLQAATNSKITYAPTIQKVPNISMKPDIGCFVLFNGDYSGLFIMNLPAAAAMEIYRRSMIYMGLPEEELATNYNADEVANCIGEIINQIIGRARGMVEAEYGLSATSNQPKAITISTAVTLTIASTLERPQCRRLSFKTQDNNSFQVEMNLEQTEFVRLYPLESDESRGVQASVDEILDNENGSSVDSGSDKDEENVDIDALLEGRV